MAAARAAVNGPMEKWPAQYSEGFRQLVASMLDPVPSKRPTAEGVGGRPPAALPTAPANSCCTLPSRLIGGSWWFNGTAGERVSADLTVPPSHFPSRSWPSAPRSSASWRRMCRPR